MTHLNALAPTHFLSWTEHMFGTNLIVAQDGQVWILHNPQLTEGQVRMDWSTINLPENPGSSQLRSEGQAFIVQITKRLEAKKGGISALAMHLRFARLRFAIEWMSRNEVHSFSALTPQHVDAILKEATSRRGAELSGKTVTAWYRLFVEAWLTRGSTWRGLAFNPTDFRTLDAWTRRGRQNDRWRPLDDSIALPLLRDAMDWLESIANLIPPMIETIWQSRSETSDLSRKKFRRATTVTMRELANSDSYLKLVKALGKPNTPPSLLIHEAVRHTQGAAIVLILFLCGCRISEATNLSSECLSTSVHNDGFEYIYIEGRLAKANGRPHRWVAPPAVSDAIEKVRALFRFLGTNAPDKLFFGINGNGILPRSDHKFQSLPPTRAAILARSFARSKFRTSPIPDEVRFHSHQGRKTFARFVVTRDRSSLDALAGQYGHVHRGITDDAYAGYDIELASLISTAEQEELTLRLSELLSARTIGGKAGAKLVEMGNAQDSIKFRGKRSVQHMAERLIASGVKLAPCDWGYCVYVEQLSACKGNKNGPNEVLRAPDVCSKCSNFVVTEWHRKWWENRHTKDSDFLRREALPDQTRMLVEQRLGRTTDVLTQITTIKRTSLV